MMNYWITCTLIFFTLTASAQIPPQEAPRDFERIRAQRVSFITTQLEFTADEATVFWPVYNEFDAKLREFRSERRTLMLRSERTDQLTDEEVAKLMQKHLDLEQKELDVKRTYHQRFLEVLPVKKVAKLYKAEQEFKLQLMKRMQEFRQRRGR